METSKSTAYRFALPERDRIVLSSTIDDAIHVIVNIFCIHGRPHVHSLIGQIDVDRLRHDLPRTNIRTLLRTSPSPRIAGRGSG
jgi:hypothetical protein